MTTRQRTRVTVNGRVYEREVEPRVTLADFLRHDLHLGGTHVGCEHGICGVCTVLIDGLPARSCLTLAVQADGMEVTTIEGLRDPETGKLHPVQQAFVDAQAAQCGYCLNGMILATVALLARIPRPTDAEARAALSHNLCRCGTHVEILRAVQLAAERVARAGAATR